MPWARLLACRLYGFDPEAMRWFTLSAAQGFEMAEQILGSFYYSGSNGLDESPRKALYWMKGAVLGGNEESKTIYHNF